MAAGHRTGVVQRLASHWPEYLIEAACLGAFIGGAAGILAARALLGGRPADPAVNYVATMPGIWGAGATFLAEAANAFVMMTTILHMTNVPRLAPFTGLAAGALVAAWITPEAPVSGMSMNPVRTFGPNVLAGALDSLWIYFAAPTIGMQIAADVHRRRRGAPAVRCAKLHHTGDVRCIFRCGHHSASMELA